MDEDLIERVRKLSAKSLSDWKNRDAFSYRLAGKGNFRLSLAKLCGIPNLREGEGRAADYDLPRIKSTIENLLLKLSHESPVSGPYWGSFAGKQIGDE